MATSGWSAEPTEMLIRGGYNVYPSEVEAVLGGHPSVGPGLGCRGPGPGARRGHRGVRRAEAWRTPFTRGTPTLEL